MTTIEARTTEDHLNELVDQVCDALSDTEQLAAASADSLRVRMGLLRRLEGRTTVATALTGAALDAVGGVEADGANSLASWLAGHTARSTGDAGRLARLAASADELPATIAALGSGAISVQAADTILRTVKRGRLGAADEVDRNLAASAATMSTKDFSTFVHDLTQTVDGAALHRDEQRQRALRTFGLTEQEDGTWRPHGLLPHEVGLKAKVVLDALETPDHPDTPKEERRSPGQRCADAFEEVFDRALDAGDLPTTAGQARPHLTVVVDEATITADLTDHEVDRDRAVKTRADVWAGLPGGHTDWSPRPLSPQAVRRICCDATWTRVMTADAQPIEVGRATPSWSGPQRTAIRVRDGGCRGPWCDRPATWSQIHHVRWWSREGGTDVTNGILLCSRCHHRIHDHNWHLDFNSTTAVATWISPQGKRVVTRPRRHRDAEHRRAG